MKLLYLTGHSLREFDNLTDVCPRERKVYIKEFKQMSIELSNMPSDLGALALELDISPALLYT
jgi:hypothetical protein